MSAPRERIVEVGGGPCRVWELGQGEPLGVLPGLGGLPRWTPFLDALARERHVIVPSLPGFPGAGEQHHRLDGHLDWISATLDLLEAAELSGADLVAAESVTLAPGGGRALVPTGVAIAIPEGFAGFVQPRSGLALRHGVTCLNTPGLIDSGYRGELKVLLVNTDPVEPFEVTQGERIAQLVIQRVEECCFTEVVELPDSERGDSGFGSTGR